MAEVERFSLAGKNALVTSGTTGIGRATAVRLAEAGCRVMVFGRSSAALQLALAAMPEESGVIGTTADQSVPADVARVFEEFDSRIGRLDILVNSAAIGARSITEAEPEQIEYVLKTNVLGVLLCTQMAATRMLAQGSGHIIQMSSMSTEVYDTGADLYVSTKTAIEGLSISLRRTLSKRGVKLTMISPGSVGTDMTDEDPETEAEMILAGRMLRPEDIADAILYALQQPERSLITQLQIRPLYQHI